MISWAKFRQKHFQVQTATHNFVSLLYARKPRNQMKPTVLLDVEEVKVKVEVEIEVEVEVEVEEVEEVDEEEVDLEEEEE